MPSLASILPSVSAPTPRSERGRAGLLPSGRSAAEEEVVADELRQAGELVRTAEKRRRRERIFPRRIDLGGGGWRAGVRSSCSVRLMLHEDAQPSGRLPSVFVDERSTLSIASESSLAALKFSRAAGGVRPVITPSDIFRQQSLNAHRSSSSHRNSRLSDPPIRVAASRPSDEGGRTRGECRYQCSSLRKSRQGNRYTRQSQKQAWLKGSLV
jgi:hypothetical protein